jgi:hypothetical protein
LMTRVVETFPSEYPSFKPSPDSENIERESVISYTDIRDWYRKATQEFWLSSPMQ